MSLPFATLVHLFLSLAAIGTPMQGSDAELPAGTATLCLRLDFPKDATREERRALVGQRLLLVGRSDLPDGPRGEQRIVEVGDDLRIRVKGLQPWVYGLERLAGATDGSDGVAPFVMELDQFYYPRPNRLTSGQVLLARGVDLHGQVMQSTGETVSGAKIVGVWAPRSIHGAGALESVCSDESGRFRFEGVVSGLTSLSASIGDSVKGELTGVELNTAMQRGTDLVIQLSNESESPASKITWGRNSGFRMILSGTMPLGWPTANELPSEEEAWIHVKCLDEGDQLLTEAPRNVTIISHFGVTVQPQRVEVLANGSVRYGPLLSGSYRVQRETRSHDRHAFMVLSRDLTLGPGETREVSLANVQHEECKTRCSGRVTLDDVALPGARVTLSDELGVVAHTTTDRYGQFNMAVAATGLLRLKAAYPDADSEHSEEVEIETNKTLWRPLRLKEQRPGQWSRIDDHFAGHACSAGDLNGDGADDLLISDATHGYVDWSRSSCVAVSGSTGELLFRVPMSRFRRSCSALGGVGDINGDGTADFGVAFRQGSSSNRPGEQGIQLRSGKEGRVLLERAFEPQASDQVRTLVSRLAHDHDGDGILDIAVRRWEPTDGEVGRVSVEVMNGATLERIQRFETETPVRRWSGSLCFLGDLDLDGVDDFIFTGRGPEPDVHVRVAFSGKTQQPIPGWEERMNAYSHSRLTAAGDLDGDGVGDLFTTSSHRLSPTEVAQTVRAVSGRTGAVLAEHVRTLPDSDGVNLILLPDLNADGLPEVLLANHGSDMFNDEASTVSVHSGADLSVLHLLQSSRSHMIFCHFGSHGCSLGDVNHDGVSDIAVCSMNAYGQSAGSVDIFSGKDGQRLRIVTKGSLSTE